MIKLKTQTWYYIYTDGKEFFLSENAPVRDDSKKNWHHPELGYRCYLKPFWIDNPVCSKNIQEFYNFNEKTS